MAYSEEFQEWWQKQKVPAINKAQIKRWCWKAWEARANDDLERERKWRKHFQETIDRDRAAGINVNEPGYWGDFS